MYIRVRDMLGKGSHVRKPAHVPKIATRCNLRRRFNATRQRRSCPIVLELRTNSTPARDPRGPNQLSFASPQWELAVVEVPGIEPGSVQDLSVLLRA